MARFRRLLHSVASGYVVLAGSAVYALATVPLALHYLSKERFALWALLAAIGGYLSLIDLGMSGAVARLLIDHKDERATGAYGSLLKTGWLVLVVQGTLIFQGNFRGNLWSCSGGKARSWLSPLS
jgi:O-antigen/teichoic acid export membrane protein